MKLYKNDYLEEYFMSATGKFFDATCLNGIKHNFMDKQTFGGYVCFWVTNRLIIEQDKRKVPFWFFGKELDVLSPITQHEYA